MDETNLVIEVKGRPHGAMEATATSAVVQALVGPGTGGLALPKIVERGDDRTRRRFVEFFTANIRNPNTRKAYSLATGEFFAWCERNRVERLEQIEPVLVAAYVETLQKRLAAPTVKQHLAAIRMMMDWLVTGGLIPFNPAASVRGPKHIVKKGVTPVLSAEEARHLLDTIGAESLKSLRDRALIGVMVYSFARVGAVVTMKVEDYYTEGRRAWFRLHEKGGKLHSVPAHHNAEAYVDAYLAAAGIGAEKKSPLFRSFDEKRTLTGRALNSNDVLRMIKRYARLANLPETICCHTFRATGITAYLENGGTIEKAQAIAAHESPKTTKLYDRTNDTISLDEVERIRI